MILGSGKLFDKKDKPKKGENIRYDELKDIKDKRKKNKKIKKRY